MQLGWFAARFRSGDEVAAARHLDQTPDGLGRPARAFCPVERRSWVHQGRRREQLVPVIAGYAFVEMGRADAHRWHDVAGRRGFLGFVTDRFGPAPIVRGVTRDVDGRPVATTLVEDLLARSTEDWVVEWGVDAKPAPKLRRGDVVKMRDVGTLENAVLDIDINIKRIRGILRAPTGVVEYLQGDSTAWVSFRGLFDREHRMPVSVRALELVDVASKRERATLMNLPVVREVARVPAVAI